MKQFCYGENALPIPSGHLKCFFFVKKRLLRRILGQYPGSCKSLTTPHYYLIYDHMQRHFGQVVSGLLLLTF